MLEFNELTSTYDATRDNFIEQVELQSSTIDLLPYDDGEGNATIGIGFNLKSTAELHQVLLELTGNSIPSGLQAAIASIVASSFTSGPGGTIDQLNSTMSSYHATHSNVSTTFSFAGDTNAQNVYNALISSYETTVDSWISGIPDSYERVVLTSFAWNQTTANPLTCTAIMQSV